MVMLLQGKDYVTLPKPRGANQLGKNTSLYCDFHKDVGYTTNACQNLRKEIHNLIQKGYLKEFQYMPIQRVINDSSTSNDQVAMCKEAICLVQSIQMVQSIHGGSTYGGITTTTQEPYAREL